MNREGPAFLIDESVAHRIPTAKKRGSKIVCVCDPFRRRKVWCESGLEEDWCKVMIARRDVIDVREQQMVTYIGADGEPVIRYFDFVVTWRSGRRTAFAVKHVEDVDDEIRAVLTAVAEQLGNRFADDFRTLTEAMVDRVSISNAWKIVDCAKDLDLEAMDEVRAYLLSAPHELRLGQIGSAIGLGERGYRAAIALIQSGALRIAPGTLIGPDAIATNSLT